MAVRNVHWLRELYIVRVPRLSLALSPLLQAGSGTSGHLTGTGNSALYFFSSITANIETSVQFSHSVVFDSLWPHGLQHTRPPCPSPTPGVYPNSCPLSRWCHPTISPSVVPFSSCPQSLPASESLPVSQFFASGGQSIGASASVLPMNIQDWFPLGWTGWISLQSKGLSRIFSNTTVQKRHWDLGGAKISLWDSKAWPWSKVLPAPSASVSEPGWVSSAPLPLEEECGWVICALGSLPVHRHALRDAVCLAGAVNWHCFPRWNFLISSSVKSQWRLESF